MAPDLARQLPSSIRLDVELAEYYREACDAYEVGDQSESAVLNEYALSRDTACNWVASCYTIQDGLTIEHIEIQKADYAVRLRAWGRQLKSIIEDIQEESNGKDENAE